MLRSNRVTLTPLVESDISPEYLETLNDSDHLQYSRNSGFTHTLSSQVQYVKSFAKSNDLLFGIKCAEDGKLLGTINCYIDFTRMTLDLGFLIFKNQQGKGYTSEALGLLIPYLEAQFPGMCAIIGSNRKNLAMHKVAKKLDFELENEKSLKDHVNLQFVRRFPKTNSEDKCVVPDFVLKAKSIGVAANDAGGAEQITWLLRNISQKVRAFLGGPAIRIFENSEIRFDRVDQINGLMECDLIITGTGWMSELEVGAIIEAKRRNIPCITVLDHWVNFRERFGRDEESQPQIIAVTNSVALQIAQEKFPAKLVWQIPDFQLESYQEAIKRVEKPPMCVLVLLEPTSASNSKFAINNDVTESLIKLAFSVKQTRRLSRVLVRPHPSQLEDPKLLRKLKEIAIEFEISKNESLIEDLEVSNVVLGFSSYAMYLSSECGINTHSFFAGMKGHWTERFPKISVLPTIL